MKRIVSEIKLTLLLMGILALAFNIQPVKAEPMTFYVDDDNTAGPWNGTVEHPYQNMTSALAYALSGYTIYVKAGEYYEHIVVRRSVLLIGENRDTTIVDGNGTGTVIQVGTSGVNIINFTIRNAGRIWIPDYGYPDSCILGRYVEHVHIENNTFANAAVCVAFGRPSSYINVSNNIVSNAAYIGIFGYALSSGNICNNAVSDCGFEGIHMDGGCSYCRIVNNTVKNCGDGISLETDTDSWSITANNLIEGNHLSGNKLASLCLWKCGTNIFRRNNITNSQCNLLVWGYDLANFMQDVDDSNTADNKILYYLTNRHSLLIESSNYSNLGSIALVNCTNVMIKDFNLTSNRDGILLASSTNCTLMNVTLSDNHGPLIYGGFPLVYGGLTFFESNNNTIIDCRICNNSYGVCLYRSDWNVFYHNSFTHNDRHLVPDFYSPFLNTSSGYFSASIWYNGLEGNHWSDYNGTDLSSGPYQNMTGSDGIGDEPYFIDANNQDSYPLMGMFSDFNATSEHQVQVICNSTVSDFHFNDTAIGFNVSGENGTKGFCRICIPAALLNGTYRVFVNGTEILPPPSLLPCSNSTHSYLYFAYELSTKEVIITPEFPSLIILTLFMITTLPVAMVYKRKYNKNKVLTASAWVSSKVRILFHIHYITSKS